MLHRIKKKNDIHEGKWSGLGGKMEKGESPEECIIREVKEEAGLTITNPILKGIITEPEFDGKNDWIVFVFTAENFEGELIECSEGQLEWVPDDKLFDLNLWEGDKLFLKWLLDGKFFSAKFNYKNGEFIGYSVNFH